MVERVTVPDMMNAREARAQAQRMLLERHPGASVVCLCMNIAGPIKRTEKIERAFAWGASAVRAVLEPYETLFDAEIHEKTGPEAMLCLHGDAQEIKRRLCFLEDGWCARQTAGYRRHRAGRQKALPNRNRSFAAQMPALRKRCACLRKKPRAQCR